MSHRIATIAVAVAIAVAGCAPGLVRDDLPSQRWHEVRAGQVVLLTNDDVDDAVARARRLERYRHALVLLYQGLFAPSTPLPIGEVRAIHVHRCRDLVDVLGEGAIARATVSADFTQRRLTLTCGSDRSAQRRVQIHEIAHTVTFHFLPGAPPWLNEGLSEYFETLEFDGDQLRAGDIPPEHERPVAYLPEVGELIAADHATFYRDRYGRLYPAAWRLVHTLLSDDHYRGRFTDFATAVAEGASTGDAWRDAFGDLAPGTLDRAYREHFGSGSTAVWTAAAPPIDPAPPSARALDAGEIADVWLEVLTSFVGDRSQGEAAAARQIAIVERQLPDWPHAAYWRAVIAADGDLPERALALDAAVRIYPYDRLLRLARLELLGRASGGRWSADTLARAAHDVVKLEQGASIAAELFVLARHRYLRGDLTRALVYARRSMRVEPGCVRCAEITASIHARRGELAEAVRMQERAIGRLGDRPVPPVMLERLARFRKARALAPSER